VAAVVMNEAVKTERRNAATRMLARLLADPTPAPLVMAGREEAFIAHLLRDASPSEVATALGLSLEVIAGGCVRLFRSSR